MITKGQALCWWPGERHSVSVISWVIALAAAYLLGSLPFAYMVAKARGVNIYQVGTGNPGAANVFRCISRPLGIAVFLADLAKGAGAIMVGSMLDIRDAWLTVVGVSAIAGHWYPLFTRFRGGAGLATAIGAGIGQTPLLGVAVVLGSFLLWSVIRSWGHLAGLGAVVFLLASLFLRRPWYETFGPLLLLVLVLLQTLAARWASRAPRPPR
jgi:glycerol-3-phosphate acyltransferase PlsY